ncbi:AAA family ATPase [Aggregicoccus sp. 17bor-14]|uniref:AAA family ATPase n=1 Tax=Myxococcaceae TaxID=31 RepID=UPI00129C8E6E|nr:MULTISPECIES: AAA family ATPase [Myxococcaceae]MBF5044574.1 AAA family ATPase [Simulacricoccus sp. 17bor-14]MRI90319.1 AAA family ATPase [Aggregicoccus sp. 17bor-14]
MASAGGQRAENRGSGPAVPGWRLKLLGSVELCGPRGRIPLEGRIAAALAYVAWSAPTPKAQLAGLLWPDTVPSQERNNLRQLLRRLRLACGEPLLQSVGQQDALVLDEAVECDLLRLREAARRGHSEEVLGLQGSLLAGLDFDELPEFTRWLDGARLAAEGWFRKLIGLELRRREDVGDLLGAIGVAETWLSLEPESEPIARTLMRLHHVAGSRHAALHVYEQLKARLAEELAVAPTEETAGLARRIARSLQQDRSAAAIASATPLQLRRPWLRVGREDAWQQLQDGWARGRVLCLAGAPGVGKSRLALDFAAAQGEFLLVTGHPADAPVAYATLTRALRQLLRVAPAGALPTWVRAELSQLLPELSPPRRARRRSEHALQVRLHGALGHALSLLAPHATSFVADDLHDWDAHSLAFLGAWIASLQTASPQSPEGPAREGSALRLLCCTEWQGGASSRWPAAEPDVAHLLAHAQRVELAPLSRVQVLALVDSLSLPHAARELGEAVWRFAGGNPFLVLEALRDWVRRAAGSADPAGVAVGSESVAATARSRVARLHPHALPAALAAAVAAEHLSEHLAEHGEGEDGRITAALVAELLQLPELEMAAALEALQRMGVVGAAPPQPFGVCGALRVALASAPATAQLLRARCAPALARRRGLAAASAAGRGARTTWDDAPDLQVLLP